MEPKTILLIEDNISEVELTKRALEKAHISNEIVIAEDGVKALDFLFGRGEFAGRDIRQFPSLILLDLNLPKLGGLEVLRQIKAEKFTRLIPIVVLTTSGEEQDIYESYNIGINSYIRKPVDFERFAEVIIQLGLYWLVINEPPPLVN
jgi:CheY-like chemotaxis protein